MPHHVTGSIMPSDIPGEENRVYRQPADVAANTAFGGVKASGIGRFGGQWAVSEFTTEHWISVQRKRRAFPT